jgi:carboxylesterase type B
MTVFNHSILIVYYTADFVETVTHPWLFAQAGEVNNVPIMRGTNSDEGSMFCSMSRDASQQDLHEYWTDY